MDLRKTEGSLQQKAEGGTQEEELWLSANMANWNTSFLWLPVAPYHPRAFAHLHI